MRPFIALLTLTLLFIVPPASARPDTGISGVYEVVVGTGDAAPLVEYFQQFGFSEVTRGKLSAARAQDLYGVDSAAVSIRMRNGDIDAHGLLRIVEWESGLGAGVGIAPAETVGQRMGYDGITMHTLWTPKLDTVKQLADQQALDTTGIQENEFGERSFVLRGPDGSTWQVIDRKRAKNAPHTELKFETTNN